jgi:hypothetical protein
MRIADPTGSLDGWHCKPISGITGRLETIGGAILVLAWPPNIPPPVQCRLTFVPLEWVICE